MESNRIKRIILYIISISVIIAVVTLIVNYVIKIDKREKAKEMQADLLAVQAKVEILKGKNSVNKDENPLKGIQVSKVAEKIPVVNKIFEKHGITGDDVAKYYILKDSDLTAMDLNDLVGKHKGTYIVNYDNYEVLYSLGYTNANGLFCFKVSEINKQPDVQKVVPVSNNETQETSAEATTEEAKPAEETKTEEAKPAEQTQAETPSANTSAEQTQTQETTNETSAETTAETPSEGTTESTSNDEAFRNILNHTKSIIK